MRPLKAGLSDPQENGHPNPTTFTHYWHSTSSVGYSLASINFVHEQFSLKREHAHYTNIMTTLDFKFAEYKRSGNSHVVRLLTPLGTYPSETVLLNDSAIFISNEICFSIAPRSTDNISDEYYSEVEWAEITELRLFGAVMLSIDRDYGYCSIFPFRSAHYLDLANLELNSETLEHIKNLLIDEINAPEREIPGCEHKIPNSYRSSYFPYLPKVCGGEEYILHKEGVRKELMAKIYSKFHLKNYLLVRGVATLIRSAMLARSDFIEEAAISAFISLDASFNMVLRILRNSGAINPSSEDAMKFISNTFYSDAEGKYFEYYYEQRIRTVHPDSRYGIFPHAPLYVDDYYHLFNDLLELYAYFICGYVNPKLRENYEQRVS
tara:strand:- start:1021 stop:2157 length:1137 start_codon:yes stop_codon:yes gene_type:complete